MRWLQRRKSRTSDGATTEPAVALTPEMILSAVSNDALTSALATELGRLIPPDLEDYDQLARYIKTLPIGLRAMAATHRLDVSLALDSLKEHFSNFNSLDYAEETLLGLRELGLDALAERFEIALMAIRPLGPQYNLKTISPDLSRQLSALTDQMWDIMRESGLDSLMDAWRTYARTHPDKVVTPKA